jgi:hypothetical protein
VTGGCTVAAGSAGLGRFAVVAPEVRAQQKVEKASEKVHGAEQAVDDADTPRARLAAEGKLANAEQEELRVRAATAPRSVKVTLANPWSGHDPGDTVDVPADEARALIGAGYVAGVDPNVPAQVEAVLA